MGKNKDNKTVNRRKQCKEKKASLMASNDQLGENASEEYASKSYSNAGGVRRSKNIT